MDSYWKKQHYPPHLYFHHKHEYPSSNNSTCTSGDWSSILLFRGAILLSYESKEQEKKKETLAVITIDYEEQFNWTYGYKLQF